MAENKSMTDIAYDILCSKKRAIQFSKLWAEVSKKSGASDDKVSQFYSDLILDGRFTSLKDNKWDLKTRRKFSESHVNVDKILIDENDAEYVGDDSAPKTLEDDNN